MAGENLSRVQQSMDYCIKTWDPRLTGTLEEPHHNTYDIEFWGLMACVQAFTWEP
jgi:hypothetical protein